MEILFHIDKNISLGSCNTSELTGRYDDTRYNIRMRITLFSGNYIHGNHIIIGPDLDPPINGTLEGDCTGLINFPLLGGVQVFVYNPSGCSITMLTTGNIFESFNTCNAAMP